MKRAKDEPEETAAERRARLKEEWERDNEEGDKEDEQRDETKEGKNTRRILPKRDIEDAFWESYAMHYNLGPDGSASHLCIEPGGPFGGQSKSDKARDKKRGYMAKRCPSCKNFCKYKTESRKFKFGSEEGKRFWSERVVKWRAKRQYVFATMKPKSKEDADKVFVYRCGVMVGQPLLEAYFDTDSGGDFTHPKTGRTVTITKKSLSKNDPTNVEYTVRINPDRTPLDDWKAIRKQLPDLKTYIPEAMEPDAILALIEGTEEAGSGGKRRKKRRGDDDARQVTDDDDEEEDDDERKLRLAKRKRDKDEEVDPDAAEESDDEPARKKKKKKSKKSKMRERLAKRAGRDEDL